MTETQSKGLPPYVKLAIAEKGAGSFDTLLAYRLANAFEVGQPFSIEVVNSIFNASRIEFGAKPSARDNLDVQNIYNTLSPHIARIKRLRGNAFSSEIFKLIFEH
jgi:hypothetical protein